MTSFALFLAVWNSLCFWQYVPYPAPQAPTSSGAIIAILAGANGHFNCSGAGPCATTAGTDTTGATLLACNTAWFSTGTPVVVTDSKLNTWTGLSTYTTASSSINLRWFYVQSPTVGTAHIITGTGGGGAMSLVCLTFSGVNATALVASSDVGQISQNSSGGTTIFPGSFAVPANDVEVTAVGFNFGAALTATVDNGGSGAAFNNIETVSNASAVGQAVGFKIVTSGVTLNPGWLPSSSVVTSVTAASFAHQ